MMQYPSILGVKYAPKGEPVIAFRKIDGSNLRAEWNSRKGFYKFGTRTRLFDAKTPVYGPAIQRFLDMQKWIVEPILEQPEWRNTKRITVFAEWWGPNSFAGVHTDPDDKMKLTVFDICIDKRGFIAPKQFADLFENHPHIAIPPVYYCGNLTDKFVDDVRSGRFARIEDYSVEEGVVCKSLSNGWMAKIKTNAYLERLKATLGNKWNDETIE